MAKQQVIVIHGGDTFATYEDYLIFLKAYEVDPSIFTRRGWKNGLQSELGEDYQVLLPQMPNKFNARYLEWKIWFEKLLPFFAREVNLVGHSLGALFLVKYLSEETIPLRVRGLFLVAGCFDENAEYTVADFKLGHSFERVTSQCPKIFIYHSEDDPVVPFSDLRCFASALPGSIERPFTDRGHFSQDDFPELVTDIRSLAL